MKQRTALIVATILTAFVLVIVGGVIARLSAAPSGAAAGPGPSQAELDNIIATYDERDRQLRLQLDEAATTIAQINQQNQTPQIIDVPAPPSADPGSGQASSQPPVFDPATQPPALPATSAPPPPTPVPAAQPPAAPQLITREQAAAAATRYVGGGTVTRIELEEEHGALIYEVRFANDSRVYVDPYSGAVVYAKLANPAPAPVPDDNGGDDDNRGSSGGGDDNRGSGGGDDDDDNGGSGGGGDDDDDDK